MGDTFAVRIGGPKGVVVKTYSKEFKLEAVHRMKTCKTISGLAAELGAARRFLYKWREQLRTEGEDALARRPGQARSKRTAGGIGQEGASCSEEESPGSFTETHCGAGETAGRQATGSRFFQAHLRACQGSDAESGRRWREAVYQGIEVSLSLEGKGLTVGRQCELAGVSRSRV
jgi:transposase-like protein